MLTFQVIALRKTQEKANKQVYSNRSRGVEVTLKFQRKGGVGRRMENRYIYEGKNPLGVSGLSQILDRGYFSQLLVIPENANGRYSGPAEAAM